jgi:hypothetical protein
MKIKSTTIFLLSILIVAFALDASAQGTPFNDPKKWGTVEADNGAVFKVDMEHTTRGDGTADTFVWAIEDAPRYIGEFVFDCRSHRYYILPDGEFQYAAPRSVARGIWALACGKSQKP